MTSCVTRTHYRYVRTSARTWAPRCWSPGLNVRRLRVRSRWRTGDAARYGTYTAARYGPLSGQRVNSNQRRQEP